MSSLMFCKCSQGWESLKRECEEEVKEEEAQHIQTTTPLQLSSDADLTDTVTTRYDVQSTTMDMLSFFAMDDG